MSNKGFYHLPVRGETAISSWRNIVEYKYIIVHHTNAWTDDIEKIKKSETRQYWFMPYHYLIEKNWNRIKYNDLEKNVGSTRNEIYNQRWIQIAFVWNYNNDTLNQSQIDTFLYLKSEIEKKKWKLEMIWHRDASPTWCPWKNINVDMFYQSEKKTTFKLSKYYSPMPNQTRYYHWSYEADVCMNCWCQKDWSWKVIKLYDCLTPANWMKLTHDKAMQLIACPKDYKLWTKFELDWVWLVTCVDRGWAIKWNRLDWWMWVWEEWLNNVYKKKSWTFIWEIK